MKRNMLIIMLLATFGVASVDIQNLKWTQDYELLVNLNTQVNNTIKGLDINKNGIRDDIEYYVEQKYKDDPFQKEIFLEAAKTIQTIITLPKKTPIKKRVELDNQLLSLYTCRDYMLYKLDVKEIEEELKDKMIFKSKVLNTNKRLRAYIDHKKLLPLEEEDIKNMSVDNERIACQKLHRSLTNKDMITSK